MPLLWKRRVHRLRRNGEDERISACSHAAEERCEMAYKKDVFGVVEMEEAECG
jgi:hypothetical protein